MKEMVALNMFINKHDIVNSFASVNLYNEQLARQSIEYYWSINRKSFSSEDSLKIGSYEKYRLELDRYGFNQTIDSSNRFIIDSETLLNHAVSEQNKLIVILQMLQLFILYLSLRLAVLQNRFNSLSCDS